MGRKDDMELDEREIEEYYRQRYNEDTAAIARFGEGGEEMSDEITQQTLLPEVKDPNLWMVKCRIGEEKQTVLQLMRKMIAYQHEEEPLQIRYFETQQDEICRSSSFLFNALVSKL